MIRFSFPLVEQVAPYIARKWARKLFFTPIRFEPPKREKEIVSSLRKFELDWNSIRIQGYEGGDGPTVLLMHGWSGRFGQFAELIESLTKGGFKVIGVDAPGHGLSKGKETNLPEFVEVIQLLLKSRGPIVGAIGHSLGGVSLLLSKKNGIDIPKIVTVSMPSISSGIITEFLKKIKGSSKTGESVRNAVVKKFNKSFDDFSAYKIASENFPKSDIMLIHDENDTEAPMYHFWEINKLFPDSKTLITQGLGHNKILRDATVSNQIIDFFNQKSKPEPMYNRGELQEK